MRNLYRFSLFEQAPDENYFCNSGFTLAKLSLVVVVVIDWEARRAKYISRLSGFNFTVFTLSRFLKRWMCKKTWCLLLLQNCSETLSFSFSNLKYIQKVVSLPKIQFSKISTFLLSAAFFLILPSKRSSCTLRKPNFPLPRSETNASSSHWSVFSLNGTSSWKYLASGLLLRLCRVQDFFHVGKHSHLTENSLTGWF